MVSPHFCPFDRPSHVFWIGDKGPRPAAYGNRGASALEIGVHDWIRITSNMANSCYDVHRALVDIPEPTWPNVMFEEILDLAYRGCTITAPDHLVIQQVQGKAR